MNKRFGNDENLNRIYELLDSAKFRNYIYDLDGKGTYCEYIDEYEVAIDDRDDRIKELEQQIKKQKEIIDKAISYISKYSTDENGDISINLFSYNCVELLDILGKTSK